MPALPPASLPPAPASSKQRGGKNCKRADNSLPPAQEQPLACITRPSSGFAITHASPFPLLQEQGMCFVIFPVRAVHSRCLGNRHPTRLHAGTTKTFHPIWLVSSCGKLYVLRNARVTEPTAINFNKALGGREKQNLKRNTTQEQSWGMTALPKYY